MNVTVEIIRKNSFKLHFPVQMPDSDFNKYINEVYCLSPKWHVNAEGSLKEV